mgnify:CR=1 FL=1
MSKEDLFVITGKISEVLPNALFRVALENNIIVLGHLAGKLRVNKVNIRRNDTVDGERAPEDLTKGRSIGRHKRQRTT